MKKIPARTFLQNFPKQWKWRTKCKQSRNFRNSDVWKVEILCFTDLEKERIALKLKNRINLEGILQLTVSEKQNTTAK